jgi:hypothetical protein
MAKNDDKIKELMALVAEKKKALGDKPKATWSTNAVFKYNSNEFFNLNTVKEPKVLVEALAFLMQRTTMITEASRALGVAAHNPEWGGYSVADWVSDFKTRLAIVNWETKKAELEATQVKLNTLVSEEARTEMEIDSIAKLLG